MKLHPEILKKNGKSQFVILTYEEFLAVQEKLEDAEDLMALRRAVKDDSKAAGISLRDVKARYGVRGTRRKQTRRRSSNGT